MTSTPKSRPDRVQRQHQSQRIIKQSQRAKALVPSRRALVFRVDGERHATYFVRHGKRTFTSRKQEIAAQSTILHGTGYGETAETKHRHFGAPELSRNGCRSFRKGNRAGADRVVAKNVCLRPRRNRDESLGTSAVVVLSRVPSQVFVQRGHSDSAVEPRPVVKARQRLLPPHQGRAHAR
ncbi:hypothetical protein SBA3_3730010 [Candidatus Sulfopaludibacter sp. SbA3]|nr:hypothetical protein SBA3_3730010 [Candidatus Sulfopaludibacter sp. SbA3]